MRESIWEVRAQLCHFGNRNVDQLPGNYHLGSLGFKDRKSFLGGSWMII